MQHLSELYGVDLHVENENNFERFVRLTEVEYLNTLENITLETTITRFDLDKMVDAINKSNNMLNDAVWVIYDCDVCGCDNYHVELLNKVHMKNYLKSLKLVYSNEFGCFTGFVSKISKMNAVELVNMFKSYGVKIEE